MKKILILNEGNSDNLGDRAINESLIYLFKKNNCDVKFIDFIGLDVQTIRILNVKVDEQYLKVILRKITPIIVRKLIAQVRWIIKINKVINKCNLKEYDLVVIGGGQLILSNFYFPMAMFKWVNKVRKTKGQKIIALGVGAANKYAKFDKWLYGNSLKNIDDIYFRDEGSQKIIQKEFGLKSKYIPDIAFYTSVLYKFDFKKSNRVLVGITDYEVFKLYNGNIKTEDEYIQQWEENILKYINRGYDVDLIYSTTEDYCQSVKLKRSIEKSYKLELKILETNNVKELAYEISKATIVHAGRMHLLILGLAYGASVMPYAISNKIKIFDEEYVKAKKDIFKLQCTIIETINKIVNCC